MNDNHVQFHYIILLLPLYIILFFIYYYFFFCDPSFLLFALPTNPFILSHYILVEFLMSIYYRFLLPTVYE